MFYFVRPQFRSLGISLRLNLVSPLQKPIGFLHSERFSPFRVRSLRSTSLCGNSAVLELLCARLLGLRFLKPVGFKPLRRCSLTGLVLLRPSAIPLSVKVNFAQIRWQYNSRKTANQSSDKRTVKKLYGIKIRQMQSNMNKPRRN